MKSQTIAALLICLSAAACQVQAQTVLHVDADSPSDGPGASWAAAFHYLQDALAAAAPGDEIRVAEGVHRPDENAANPNGTDLRSATFMLVDGVTLAGGYAGYGAADPNARGLETVLSGDIGAEGISSDNSKHVVTGYFIGPDAVLDGFTITAGNVGGWYGGGMMNTAASPTLIDCDFIGNTALSSGGGMYNEYLSEPTLIDCRFIENTASSGGGMFNEWDCLPTLINCTFSNNSAGYSGGGMRNWGCSPVLIDCAFVENDAREGGGMDNYCESCPKLTRCTFVGNSASEGGGISNDILSNPILTDCSFMGNNSVNWGGGGMRNLYSDPTLINCIFSGNRAVSDYPEFGCGGAVLSYGDAETKFYLLNCVFSGNSAVYGGAIAIEDESFFRITNCSFSGNSAEQGGAIFHETASGSLLINCILWGDSPDEIHGGLASGVLFSCIQGGAAGHGNIDADPRFVNVNGADGILGTLDDDLRLSSRSDCIDAGLSVAAETDLDGNRRAVTHIWDPPGVGFPEVVDMGAYEYDSTPPEPWPDLDRDCDVDLSDLAILLAHYGETCY